MKGTLENFNGIKEPMPVAVKVPKGIASLFTNNLSARIHMYVLADNRKTVQDLVAEVNVWTRIGKHANVIGLVGVSVFEGTRRIHSGKTHHTCMHQVRWVACYGLSWNTRNTAV